VRESRTPGSVRGDRGNPVPYRVRDRPAKKRLLVNHLACRRGPNGAFVFGRSRQRPPSMSGKGSATDGNKTILFQLDSGTARASSKVSLPGQGRETGPDGPVMSFTRILILPLDGLERAAVAGRRWVTGLARGLGAQIAGEREERAREAERQRQAQGRAEAARRAEVERQEAARLAERERVAAELRKREAAQTKPAITQVQRDAARKRQVWDQVEEAGRQARTADRARLGPDHKRSGEREGPSMGR